MHTPRRPSLQSLLPTRSLLAKLMTKLPATALLGLGWVAVCGAQSSYSQTWPPTSAPQLAAPSAAAPLPLRNLSIELRQVAAGASTQESVQAQGSVVLGGDASQARIGLQANQASNEGQRQLSQRLLVLNGRPAQWMLGQLTPVRLRWLGDRGGALVLLERNSGLTVRPVWGGGDTVTLDLLTQLAGAAGPAGGSGFTGSTGGMVTGRIVIGPGGTITSNSSGGTITAGGPQGAPSLDSRSQSSLVVPLAQWVTVAESQQEDSATGSGGSRSGRSQWMVQVRVSVSP